VRVSRNSRHRRPPSSTYIKLPSPINRRKRRKRTSQRGNLRICVEISEKLRYCVDTDWLVAARSQSSHEYPALGNLSLLAFCLSFVCPLLVIPQGSAVCTVLSPIQKIVLFTEAERPRMFFLNIENIVISTEAAHSFVSSVVEKSASLPRLLPNQRRAFAIGCLPFCLSSRRDLLLRLPLRWPCSCFSIRLAEVFLLHIVPESNA